MNRLVLMMISFLAFTAKADFDSGMQNYAKKQYPEAYREFVELAKIGESRAQFNLGVMYLNGEHVTQDINQAYAWIKLAAENRELTAQTQSALDSISAKINNLSLAEETFQRLKSAYSAEALTHSLYPQVGETSYFNSFLATPLKISAPDYPRKEARKRQNGWVMFEFDLDNVGEIRNLAVVDYFPSSNFVKPAAKSIREWKFKPKIDDSGNIVAQQRLRFKLEFKLKEENADSEDSELQEMIRLAYAGNAKSQYEFASYLQSSAILAKKYSPNEWMLKSAIQGNELAQFQLGRNLLLGLGCQADEAKALKWLTLAKQNSQNDANELLMSVMSTSADLESQQIAASFYQNLAEPNVRTLLDYAKMLVNSSFSQIKNPEKAIELMETLSDQYFWDEATILEITAAAHAARGDYAKAVDVQQDALNSAKKHTKDLQQIKSNLAIYLQKLSATDNTNV